MIEIRGLHKRYPDGQEALRGVDLDVGDGMLGLLGPNGAGKTTLLSVLVLAVQPTAGSCRHDGLDPARPADRPVILRRLGYLPQDFSPVGHLTGQEYLVHCAGLRGVPLRSRELRLRAHEMLEAVGLAHAAHQRSATYSGGMRRRLGLAQALLHAPRLLVVDEPTSGLDPEERIRFRNLIAEVAEFTAVLLSTHIVEDIEATCPRLAVLAGGRMLFDGEPTSILLQARDRLWEIDDGEATDHPVVGTRIDDEGRAASIVFSKDAPPGARAVEPTLEMAYAAFLRQHGEKDAGAA